MEAKGMSSTGTQEMSVRELIEAGMYEEALQHSKNNSFEKAYCYYKIGKYRSALKTAAKKQGEKWSALRMQTYYCLDRYAEALKESKSLPKKGAVFVNYAAALSLHIMEHPKNISQKNECREIAQKLEEPLKSEVLYNLTLSSLPNRERVIEELKEINTESADVDTQEIVHAQISTLEGKHERISSERLLKRNRAIHQWNAGNKEELQENKESFLGTLRKFQREALRRAETQ
ncbi:hypothetical protein NEFER03_1155 [Nematocida sp. LUAm3]|nr:hypothetical protein NEFER03_1155 [Nematocida sp. LUAm3]KAI5175764.1 hypothetical protein NEFER02_1633 [Nematocida sp. LUAm2]KAI5178260.1 hypothetical protein NEFER01_1427 [Nematocida sp. LUAm1]